MVEPIGELRKICQNSRKYAKKYRMNPWRKVSIYFTKALLYTNITANQVTILCALIGVLGGILLAFGNWYSIAGALLLHLHVIFDFVDGEVARYRKSESLTGIYLDLLCHHIVNPIVFVGISFNVYNVFHDPNVFIFGFSAILSRKLIVLTRQCKFQAIFYGYFYHRSGENVNKRQLRGQGKEGKIPPASDFDEKTYLASRSQVLYKISHITLILQGQFMRDILILLASLTGMAIPLTMIGSLKLNLMYIVLIFYGTFSHLLWPALVFLAIKTKSIDKLYSLLFK